nr:hypothetical protein GCM10020093_100370 [Planobispora longispora]
MEAELRARLASPEDATPLERLDLVERTIAAKVFPVVPTILPSALAGLAMFGLASRLLGDRARPGEMLTVLRGLPHNVTTEMDLALWDLATRIRRDAEAASLLLTTPAADLAARFHAGSLPAAVDGGCASSWRRTASARWPRSTSGCPAGRRIRRTSSAWWPTICGWTTRRWPPTPCSPRAPPRRPARSRP